MLITDCLPFFIILIFVEIVIKHVIGTAPTTDRIEKRGPFATTPGTYTRLNDIFSVATVRTVRFDLLKLLKGCLRPVLLTINYSNNHIVLVQVLF